MTLSTSVLHDDGLALLALDGELDAAVAERVDAAVSELLDDGLTLLVVDLGHLVFCDSSGLGALLRTSRALRAAGGSCRVAGASGPVQRLMDLTRMGQVLDLVPDVRTALTDLRRVADTPLPGVDGVD